MWRVPWATGTTSSGHTDQIVEMLDVYPTLVELAGLPQVASCNGMDPDPSTHCLHGRSYASAFGVGSSPKRDFAIMQWPYADYANPAAPATRTPQLAQGTMAYAIRNRDYRYIVNMKYDAKKYVPIWTEQVSQQLYTCDLDSTNPASLICDETVNLAQPPGGPSASVKATMATLHAQLKAALHEGTVSLETDAAGMSISS